MTGTTHILFSTAAAGMLYGLLAAEGSADAVIALEDNLAIGPPATAWEERFDWLVGQGRIDPAIAVMIAMSGDDFRAKCDAAEGDLLVWLMPHSARERAGLAAWLDRSGARPAAVLDAGAAAHEGYPPDHPPLTLGELTPGHMAALLAGARAGGTSALQPDGGRWAALVREGGALRVLRAGELVSAPADFFDALLIRACAADWRPVASILGDAMILAYRERHDVDDIFLVSRLFALVAAGALRSAEDIGGWPEDRLRREGRLRPALAKIS